VPLSYPSVGFKDETALNKHLRSRIKGLGFQCVHVKETDTPGPLDLLAWKGTFYVWIELKLDDERVRESQREFIRTQYKEGVRAFVVRYWNDTENYVVSRWVAGNSLMVQLSTSNELEMLNYVLNR
jgi:hypothetical protein